MRPINFDVRTAGTGHPAPSRETSPDQKGYLMSAPRGYGLNGLHYFTNVAKPIDCNLQFTVDATNGLGVTSVKSNGFVESVFMHTSTTPTAVGNQTNPNPAAGYALVRFKNNFNKYLGEFGSQIIPLAGSDLTSTTINLSYVITSVGTTTLAQWQAKGLPPGLTPTVGQAFVATATGALGGTGTVKVPGVPAAFFVSVVGDPNATLANSDVGSNAGAYLLIQFSAATNSSTTTLVATAPADGTIVSLCFRFDGSSVTVDGL